MDALERQVWEGIRGHCSVFGLTPKNQPPSEDAVSVCGIVVPSEQDYYVDLATWFWMTKIRDPFYINDFRAFLVIRNDALWDKLDEYREVRWLPLVGNWWVSDTKTTDTQTYSFSPDKLWFEEDPDNFTLLIWKSDIRGYRGILRTAVMDNDDDKVSVIMEALQTLMEQDTDLVIVVATDYLMPFNPPVSEPITWSASEILLHLRGTEI